MTQPRTHTDSNLRSIIRHSFSVSFVLLIVFFFLDILYVAHFLFSDKSWDLRLFIAFACVESGGLSNDPMGSD